MTARTEQLEATAGTHAEPGGAMGKWRAFPGTGVIGSLQPPVTVLVTAAGSAPAVAVIQALRRQSELPVRIVAADMDAFSVGFALADDQALIPAADDPVFIPRMLELCHRSGARVVFPIIDEELQPFADAAPQFAAHGVHLVSNRPEVVRVAKDKWLTYGWCSRQGVRMPRTWLAERIESHVSFPVIVKPRAGRGSAGVAVVRNTAELEYQLARGNDLLVQELIDGPEYTVDILGDDQGRILSAVPRERLITKAGMCVKGRTVQQPRLLELAVHVAEQFGLAPRGNLQFKRSERDGEYYLIEINPKFGAGLPITVAAGVNMPVLILKMLMGESVPPMLGQFQGDLLMLRHWAEVFVTAEALAPSLR